MQLVGGPQATLLLNNHESCINDDGDGGREEEVMASG